MRTRYRYEEAEQSINPSGYWLGTWTDIEPYTPVTKLEWMEDDVYDFKSLGRTLNDIGGPLYHIKIEVLRDQLDLFESHNSFGGAKQAYIPMVGNGSDTTSRALASKCLLVLKGVMDGKKLGTLSKDSVKSLIDNQLVPHLGLSDLSVHGANFVNAVLPTNPSVDLATTVAELLAERKFFSIPGTSNSTAGEWLNFQLALSPAWSTVKDLRTTMEDSEALLKQYERDSGKLVRRRYEPPVDRKSGVDNSVTFIERGSLAVAGFYAGLGGSWTSTYESSIKRWFSGAFSYALPQGGWRRTLTELDYLYGVVPGIDTVWELLPFSFVADYFANMGNVLQNLNAFSVDGLVMPYGYVMERHTRTWHFTGLMTAPHPRTPVKSRPVDFKIKLEVNRRLAANPFGFGVGESDLSARQLSILAALGITTFR